MADDTGFVIVGASLAGAKAAETLPGSEQFGGPVVLLGTEDELPYERPPLSKDYLLGKAERDKIYVHPEDWYASNDVDLRRGVTVTGIDRAARAVTLADGGQVGYSKLLLTTGSAPRRLPVPGADLDGVLYLRTAADSDKLKDAFTSGARIVVIEVRAGSGSRRRPRPGRRAPTSPCSKPPSCRCCGCSAARSR